MWNDHVIAEEDAAGTARELILRAAIKHTTRDREDQYGDPTTCLNDIARLQTAYLIGKYRGATVDEDCFSVTAEDVAWLNVLQKIVRAFNSDKADTYEDAAGYAAIAYECSLVAGAE